MSDRGGKKRKERDLLSWKKASAFFTILFFFFKGTKERKTEIGKSENCVKESQKLLSFYYF